MKGYTGKILTIDLTSRTWEEETIDDTVYENLLSGVGLGVYYLYRNIPAGADPLGPENILGFTAGLLTGTGSVMTGRWMAVCKSPLTGGWGDSNCGGNLAPAIKQCGYDAVFITGAAETPVYIYIGDGGPEIRDGADYWGLDAVEAEEALLRDCGDKKKPAVAVIGPAGERLSLIAGISNDLGRFAARSGVGAVMGSKKLKALVLAGSKPVRGADPDRIKSLSREYADKVRRANPPGILRGFLFPLLGKLTLGSKHAAPMDGFITVMLLKKYGTSMNNTMAAVTGDAPLKNWGGSVADYGRSRYRHLNPEWIIRRETRKYHCYSCVIGCGGICDITGIRDGAFHRTHKPEYETAMSFGGLVMNRDLDAIFYINELLNRAGMDTISAGGAAAFAVECYEKGIISKEDTGGLELRWGDAESIITLVKKMIAREGIGDLLADGVKEAARKMGKGSEAFAVHAGGQELPMHDPKLDPMMGVAYAADPTPGRHTTSGGTYFSTSFLWDYVSWVPKLVRHPKSEDFEPLEKTSLQNVGMTCFKMLVDGSGSCYYAMLTGLRHFKIFEYLDAATGWDRGPDEYMEIGRRIQTLRQLFNVKHGALPARKGLHPRAAGDPPLEAGPLRGVRLNTEKMVPLYWEAWGWDPHTGIPTAETLNTLSLSELLGGDIDVPVSVENPEKTDG
jgi:aldehyde:ferredoxin oxidoreductase